MSACLLHRRHRSGCGSCLPGHVGQVPQAGTTRNRAVSRPEIAGAKIRALLNQHQLALVVAEHEIFIAARDLSRDHVAVSVKAKPRTHD